MRLQTRGFVYTCGPIVLGFGLVVAATWQILAYASDVGIERWLAGSASRVTDAYDERVRENLELRTDELARAGLLRSGEASLVAERLRAEVDEDPSLAYTLRDRHGHLVAGADCRVNVDGRGLCDGRPAIVSTVTTPDGELLLGRRIDAGYLASIAAISQTEVVLTTADAVLLGTTVDVQGYGYRPEIGSTASGWLTDAPRFERGVMGGGSYGGYAMLDGTDVTLAERGKDEVPVYLMTRPLGAGHWLVFAVPIQPVRIGVWYETGIVGLMTLVVTLAVVATVALYVRRLTGPLATLADTAKRVEAGDLTSRVAVIGDDEVADVQRTFNGMVVSLRRGQRDLTEAARVAGMAEVATGVLHNVGNLLTSVNVAVEVVTAGVVRLPGERLAIAARMLKAHAEDLPEYLTRDPRGSLLPTYIEETGCHIEAERTRLITEVAELRANIDRIKAVVAMQQTYARRRTTGRTREGLDAVIRDAIELIRPQYETHGIAIELHPSDAPPMLLDVPGLTQVLGNLLANAKDAVLESQTMARRVIVSASVASGHLRVDVRDNGTGIAPDRIGELFRFGYTTKVDGHGFGLHMSAIAAQAMGGSLVARSDGAGCGATFTLDVPELPPSGARTETRSAEGPVTRYAAPSP
jgi:signal transduction histidine kinase